MANFTPAELKTQLGSGLLSFPVTHFDDELNLDMHAYRGHLSWLGGFDVAGLFAAGGTGEGFSLSNAEIDRVVRAAVDEVDGRLPVLAPAMGATVNAIEQAKAAEDAGADGILIFPPYLTEASQEGLVAHLRAICSATRLGCIIYSRANAVLTDASVAALADRCQNLIGLKDGVGNVELMARIFAKLGDRLTFIGGLPTAETFALPYMEMGVTTYSSAMFNFVPSFARDFYADVRAGDRAAVYRRLNDFVIPYLDIRDRRPGFGVSIVKAGLDAAGRTGGLVRPPLTNLSETDRADLATLVASVQR